MTSFFKKKNETNALAALTKTTPSSPKQTATPPQPATGNQQPPSPKAETKAPSVPGKVDAAKQTAAPPQAAAAKQQPPSPKSETKADVAKQVVAPPQAATTKQQPPSPKAETKAASVPPPATGKQQPPSPKAETKATPVPGKEEAAKQAVAPPQAATAKQQPAVPNAETKAALIPGKSGTLGNASPQSSPTQAAAKQAAVPPPPKTEANATSVTSPPSPLQIAVTETDAATGSSAPDVASGKQTSTAVTPLSGLADGRAKGTTPTATLDAPPSPDFAARKDLVDRSDLQDSSVISIGDVSTTVTGNSPRLGDLSDRSQQVTPRRSRPSMLPPGASPRNAQQNNTGFASNSGPRKSVLAGQSQQGRSRSYLDNPFLEDDEEQDVEAKAHTIRSFARWASGGNWDLLRDLYKAEPSEITANYGALRKRNNSERRSVAFTENEIQHHNERQRGSSSVPRLSVVSSTSAMTSQRSSGSRAASQPRSSVVAVPGGTITAGSSRPSNVAGATPRRSLTPRAGSSTQQAFVNDLRSGVDNRKSRKSAKISSREVSCKEFVYVVRKNGFQGNAMTIFSEIQSECAEVEHMRGKKGEAAADDTTTIWQLQSFQKRLDVVKETFACFLRLKRGTTLRAWRLDIDYSANGKGKSRDFVRYCRSLGLEEQGKFIVNSIRGGGEDVPLEFYHIDPGEAMNAEAFAERLLSSVHWDVERAWQVLDPREEGAVTFEQFRTTAKRVGFDGQIRPLFEGLDTGGQGRLWRDDIDYLWVVTIPRIQKRREEAEAIEYVEAMDRSPSQSQHEQASISFDNWEPSENEPVARDFAQWACTNWDTIYELFTFEERRMHQGVTAVELERWLHMLGYFNDIAAVFLEISRERPRSGDYDESICTKLQLTAFRQRRNAITVKEFSDHLLRRRGSAFRAWKLDMDLLSTGLVEYYDFLKASRRIGIGDDVVCVWDYAHMQAGNYIESTKIPICFHDLFPEESDNLQSFGEHLLEYARFDLIAAWEAMDENGDGCLTMEEVEEVAEKMDWTGDVELVYSGLASNNGGYLWPQDLDYLWTVVFHRLRMKWKEPPIQALSSVRQAQLGGPFVMLGRLGLDHRGLDQHGEQMTLAQIARGLEELGYTGNVLRAATELVWKVLSGHDVEASKSAKGKFSKPVALQEDKPTWFLRLDKVLVRNPNTKSIVNSVFDGDKGVERRRRIHNWHDSIKNKRERFGP